MQRERGKVIGVDVHIYKIYVYRYICGPQKIFESHFSDPFTFSNIRSRTSRRIYGLALTTVFSRNAFLIEYQEHYYRCITVCRPDNKLEKCEELHLRSGLPLAAIATMSKRNSGTSLHITSIKLLLH